MEVGRELIQDNSKSVTLAFIATEQYCYYQEEQYLQFSYVDHWIKKLKNSYIENRPKATKTKKEKHQKRKCRKREKEKQTRERQVAKFTSKPIWQFPQQNEYQYVPPLTATSLKATCSKKQQ